MTKNDLEKIEHDKDRTLFFIILGYKDIVDSKYKYKYLKGDYEQKMYRAYKNCVKDLKNIIRNFKKK